MWGHTLGLFISAAHQLDLLVTLDGYGMESS